MKKKWIIIIGLVALILMFSVIAFIKKPKTEDTIGGYKKGPRVKIEKVKKEDIQTRISTSGKLEAKNTSTVYLNNANKVVQVHKKVGDTVKKGEVIVTLDEVVTQKISNDLEATRLRLQAAQQSLNKLLSGGSKQEILAAQSSIIQYEKQELDAKDMIERETTNLENYKIDLENQKQEYKIQEELFSQGLASQKELDNAKIALDKMKQQVESTEAAITSAKKSLEVAKTQREKAEYDLGVLLNKYEDKNKRQQIDAAQAEIKAIENQLYALENDVQRAQNTIVAPIDGVIIVGPEEEGMSLSPNTPVVTIVDPSDLIVTCQISPYYAPDLKVGLDAIVKYTGSKTIEANAKVTKVSQVAIASKNAADMSKDTATIPIEVHVTDKNSVLRPGFSVDVKVITESRTNVCTLPILATMEDDEGETYVYVVKEDGSLEKRIIKQGLSNGLYVEAENISEGEIIVSNPTDYLTEGMKVSYEKLGDM